MNKELTIKGEKMKDLEYYTKLRKVIDEAIKNCVNNVADIGRLNDIAIETTKRLNKVRK